MKILVSGSRNWKNKKLIEDKLIELRNLYPKWEEIILIHGDCRGADRIAARIGKKLGMTIWTYPPDGKKYGKLAGPIRNTEMLKEGEPNLVYAFIINIKWSRGTKDLIEKARRRKVHVEVFENGIN